MESTILVYWNEVIELGTEVEEVKDYETTSSFTFEKVFANKVSIKQQEHYNANKLGLKPEIAFEVRIEEYKGETVVRVNEEKIYQLIRTFDNQRNGTVELYLTSEMSDKNEYSN